MNFNHKFLHFFDLLILCNIIVEKLCQLWRTGLSKGGIIPDRSVQKSGNITLLCNIR